MLAVASARMFTARTSEFLDDHRVDTRHGRTAVAACRTQCATAFDT